MGRHNYLLCLFVFVIFFLSKVYFVFNHFFFSPSENSPRAPASPRGRVLARCPALLPGHRERGLGVNALVAGSDHGWILKFCEDRLKIGSGPFYVIFVALRRFSFQLEVSALHYFFSCLARVTKCNPWLGAQCNPARGKTRRQCVTKRFMFRSRIPWCWLLRLRLGFGKLFDTRKPHSHAVSFSRLFGMY